MGILNNLSVKGGYFLFKTEKLKKSVDKNRYMCDNTFKLKIAFDRGAGFISSTNALRQMSLCEREHRRRNTCLP